MKKQKRLKKVFNPVNIHNRISRALDCDLALPQQVYGDAGRAAMMLRDRQRAEFGKKFSDPSACSDDLAVTTYIKFVLVNNHMSNFTSSSLMLPREDQHRPQSRFDYRTNVLLRARALMHFVLTPFDDEDWFHACKHGTGTSIGVPYRDTSLEAKSKFPISITSRAAPIFDDYLRFDSQLNRALLRFNSANPVSGRYDIKRGSQATTVPKNDKIRRMIAIEPTGNMFLQQGLMSLLYDRMEAVSLDVSLLPTIHRQRARQASIDSKEATIDWSSASDCVSIDLLRWLLPPKWFECLDRVRSQSITILGESLELNMFSTMGNAGTFPLETLVFWTLAHAVRLENSGSLTLFPEWKDLKCVSVFGDDCIVPTDMASDFIEIATSVGFIVNEEKSFFDDEGFRESCGGDYLRGYDVRPYSNKAPTSVSLSALEPWLYITFNSLQQKYITCFGELMYVADMELWKLMVSLFMEYDIAVKLVPPYFPDDAGLKISSDINRFVSLYPGMKFSRIGKTRMGLYDFAFCRFNYRKNATRYEELHFLTWLKRPGGKRNPWWQTKRNGGYVVARGRSSCWSLPTLRIESDLGLTHSPSISS